MKKITKSFIILFFTILMTFTFMSIQSYGTTGTKYFSLYLKSGQVSRNGRPTGFYTTGTTTDRTQLLKLSK